MIERAGERKIVLAAFERALPARFAGDRGQALHEARGHRRRARDLGGAGEDDFRRAERLREVVRGQSDAPLRRIEPEIAPHRPRQPRIAARFGRPAAFVEAAEHKAVGALQARFQRAVNVNAHIACFRAAHDATADAGMEDFCIIAAGDGEAGRGRACDQVVERARKRRAVVASEGGDVAFIVLAQRGDDVTMTLRQRGERMIAGFERFQRRQRGGEPVDQRTGGIKLVFSNQPARVAAMHGVAVGAEGLQRVGQAIRSGSRPRPAQ